MAGHILSELNDGLNRLLQMLERFLRRISGSSHWAKRKQTTPDLALTLMCSHSLIWENFKWVCWWAYLHLQSSSLPFCYGQWQRATQSTFVRV